MVGDESGNPDTMFTRFTANWRSEPDHRAATETAIFHFPPKKKTAEYSPKTNKWNMNGKRAAIRVVHLPTNMNNLTTWVTAYKLRWWQTNVGYSFHTITRITSAVVKILRMTLEGNGGISFRKAKASGVRLRSVIPKSTAKLGASPRVTAYHHLNTSHPNDQHHRPPPLAQPPPALPLPVVSVPPVKWSQTRLPGRSYVRRRLHRRRPVRSCPSPPSGQTRAAWRAVGRGTDR